MYKYINENYFDYHYTSFNTIRFIETKHCDTLDSYSILFTTDKGIVYYSGDTNEISIIKSLIDSEVEIDKLYIDTTNVDFPNNPHLYIGRLKHEIPDKLKSKIYCMHVNNDGCIDEALSLGFKVANIDKSLKRTRN